MESEQEKLDSEQAGWTVNRISLTGAGEADNEQERLDSEQERLTMGIRGCREQERLDMEQERLTMSRRGWA
jgi:hypothetical protein